MTSGRAWQLAVWAARLAIAGVFLAAAFPKLVDPAGFADKLPNYRVFPDPLVNLIAVVVPPLELLSALALLTGRFYRGGVWLATLLMATFTALIGTILARGIDLDCGCFGAISSAPTSGLDLARNVVLLGLAALLLVDLRRLPVVDTRR